MVLYIYLHVATPANSGKGRYLSWGRLTRQVLPGHPGMGKTLWAISQNPLLKQIWPGFLNGNYEKIMLIENSDNEVISIYIYIMICVFLDLLYIRYRSIYIKQTHTCCIFEHNIIHLTSTLLRTSPKHRTLSSWSNGRVSATHWSCASWRVKYLKFSADEPRHSPTRFLLGKTSQWYEA